MFEIIKDGSWVVLEDGVFIADFNTRAEAEYYVSRIKRYRRVG